MSTWQRFFALLGVVILILVTGLLALGTWALSHPSLANTHDGTGQCILHGRAAVLGRDQELVRLAGWRSDALLLRNDDGPTWEHVEITLEGLGKYGTEKRKPTGRYRTTYGNESRNAFWLPLDRFRNAAGDTWNSATMTVDVISVKATLRGESCSAEISPSSVPKP